MNTITIKGIINIGPHGDSDDVVFIDGIDDPLAEYLENEGVKNKQVSVRYFVAGKPETKALLIEGLIQKLYGEADVKYEKHYSEYTGYIWTDEDLNIGGHDLLSEIRSHRGKFLYMEIDLL